MLHAPPGVEPGRRERPRQGGVGIAKDDHSIGLLMQQHVFKRFQHAPGLRPVRCRANPQMVIGRWNRHLLKEVGRERRVIVLAGVNNQFLV